MLVKTKSDYVIYGGITIFAASASNICNFINAHKYTEEELDYLLKALSETTSYGTILRSKGIIQMTDGSWKQFDLVPEEYEVREGQPDYTGRICVIGTDLKEDDLLKLFHV